MRLTVLKMLCNCCQRVLIYSKLHTHPVDIDRKMGIVKCETQEPLTPMRCHAPQIKTGTSMEREKRTLRQRIPLVPSAPARQTRSQRTARQQLYQTPRSLSSKMPYAYNILILGPSSSEVYEERTYAKYAILANIYNVAVIPSPSGPAILRVRTGSLTSLST